MAESSLTKNSVLKIFRQIKNNSTRDDQEKLWRYITSETTVKTRRNLAAALQKGGDGARDSLASLVQVWHSRDYLTMNKGGKQQDQQGQRQQRQQQQQQQQQQAAASGRHRSPPSASSASTSPTARSGRGNGATAHGKGMGAPLATSTPSSAKGAGAKGGNSGPSRSVAAKGKTRSRCSWADLHVSSQTPLLDDQGGIAPKCTLGPDDDQEALERAQGYIMTGPTAASQLVFRLAKRVDASRPVVLIQQPMAEGEKRAMRNQLRDWEDKLNGNLTEDQQPFALDISEHSLILHDVVNDNMEAKNVVVIHINGNNSYSLGGQEAAEHLGMDIVPELHCPEDPESDIVMTVVRPLCQDTGVGEWAEDLFNIQDRKEVVKSLQKLAKSGKVDPTLRVRVMADRNYVHHGKSMQDARIRSVITIPTSEVDDYLARSGQFGVLFEHPERHLNAELRRVNLPLDHDLNDSLNAVADAAPEVRKKILGIVPTSRGFAFRVRPEDQADATRAVVPELADQLGPSLGLQPDSTWLVKNLPRRIAKQEIIKLFASAMGPWTPWHVLPKFAVGDRRAAGSSWVVEAEEPPPRRALRVRGTCATIERYTDERALTPSCRVWAKPISQWEGAAARATAARPVRKPWADTVDDDDEMDFDGGNDDDYLDVEGGADGQVNTDGQDTQQHEQQTQQERQPQRATRVPQQSSFPPITSRRTPYTFGDALAAGEAQRRPRAYRLTDSSGTDSVGPPKHKKRFGETGRRDPWRDTSMIDPEKEAMREALKAKDDQIASMQASLSKMQAMMEALMASLASNGTISTQTAAATMVEVQQAAAPPQALEAAQQQQAHSHSMWTSSGTADDADNGAL